MSASSHPTPTQEQEANWLAGCLLPPAPCYVGAPTAGWTATQSPRPTPSASPSPHTDCGRAAWNARSPPHLRAADGRSYTSRLQCVGWQSVSSPWPTGGVIALARSGDPTLSLIACVDLGAADIRRDARRSEHLANVSQERGVVLPGTECPLRHRNGDAVSVRGRYADVLIRKPGVADGAQGFCTVPVGEPH